MTMAAFLTDSGVRKFVDNQTMHYELTIQRYTDSGSYRQA